LEFDEEIQKRKTDVRALQDKAFQMFQQAKILVNDNKKEEAIAVYIELIEILNLLRWSNVSKKIQEAIQELRQSISEEISQPVIKEEHVTQERTIESEPTAPLFRSHTQSIKEFELYKQQQDTIQKNAFALLDSGVIYANKKDYERAIEEYNQAIILLNSIGWQSYTPRILEKVEQWVENLKSYNAALQKPLEPPYIETLDQFRHSREDLHKEIESRKDSIEDFDERKKIQYNYLIRASQLLLECEASVKNLDYPSLYSILQQAVQNLINVGWQEGVSHLTEIISTIKENQFQHELMEQQEQLAYIEKIRISDDIRKHFKEKIHEIEDQKGKPFHRKEDQPTQSKTKSYEHQVFDVITEASELTGTDDVSSKRKIELYKVVYHLVEQSHWSEEKLKVQSIIDILNKNLEVRRQRILTLDQNTSYELDSLNSFSKQLKEYIQQFDLEKEAQKVNFLKLQEQQQSFQSIENIAFKFIDNANQYVKKLEYDSAIEAYQEAIKKFKILQWLDQIPYIENEIEKTIKLKTQIASDQKLKNQLQEQQQQHLQAQKRAENLQKEHELQELHDISKMISGVVQQKEFQKKSENKSEEEYRLNVEKPEEDRKIREFKTLIREASKKKPSNKDSMEG